MEEVVESSEKEIQFFQKRSFLWVVAGVTILIFCFFVYSSLSYNFYQKDFSEFQKCGDGTFEGYCSLSKPYYCSGGILIQNVSKCGCPDSATFSSGECLSEYSRNGTFSSFNYFLGGTQKNLSLETYPLLLNYLLNLSRAKIYYGGELPRRDDFKLSQINEPIQSDYLNPLVVKIQNLAPDSKEIQARIAISLVQNIPYNESKFVSILGTKVRLSRYPYQVLIENQGSCEGKSELLAYILRKIGFGVVLFYFPEGDHEAVGIKCPIENSYLGTGYCFVETTVPSLISFSDGEYLNAEGLSKLKGKPEFVLISDGISLPKNLEDYQDSKILSSLMNKISNSGSLNPIDNSRMNSLREKYHLAF